MDNPSTYVAQLITPPADLHLASAMHARALPRGLQINGSTLSLRDLRCVHPTASSLSLEAWTSCPRSLSSLHHTTGWLAHTLSNHRQTPSSLLPSGQPRLPRSRNRPLIHTAMATSRRHAQTLAAYICTALTQPYRSLHLHRTLK
jgi:hypothetical protein